ncbi:MAG TPA: ABC transporter substrate-binding protein [Actinophytocola sp.]|uniref:ABC transporter substrate-binding protein n=1 Tax=Actinophytocola sp. TaxID=1872138 RepID=UPI002E0ACBBC|nr:ABC transporter substrate-binding protein [Actinophytocola sp.]
MISRGVTSAIAVVSVVALTLAACGGDRGQGAGGSTSTAAFNAALGKVFNPSDKKGGIVKFANSDDWDSLDPADTYYGYSWNFARLYTRALVMFKVAPGKASEELVPDLAESLGKPGDGGKTWTYKIRKGVRYEDGTEVKAKDVKYNVLRALDRETFPNGPDYFKQFLNLPEDYKGPYKSKGVDTNSGIETPDDHTIVFHLRQAFGGFDYLAQLPQTAPVPEARDTGGKYKEHVVSSGPYMFDKVDPGKRFTLKRNPNWDASTDQNRTALPDGYEVTLKQNADDIDNQLLAGSLQVDVQGTGIQSAKLGTVLNNPDDKARADNPNFPLLWYTSVISTVKPLDNVHCRRAIMYGMDRAGYQLAYGGAVAGGDLASTVLPPLIPGYTKFDLYPAGADNKGDLTKAKDELAQCGQPNGFETNLGYREDRPKEKATAEAFQAALARAGIKLTLRGFPSGDYFAQFCGNPPFVRSNGLGLCINGWQADWNDGFGMLSQIVDSRVIKETGGSSNMSVRIPEVDKMLDQAIAETDKSKREQLWRQIDKRIMEEAVIYPGLYAKSLLVRGQGLTNVFVTQAYGMYDYLSIGLA